MNPVQGIPSYTLLKVAMKPMVELSGNIPFMWRLSGETRDGGSVVSMVVPFDEEDDRKDLTIETSVVSFSADSSRAEQEEEMLEWNQDDISLFLKLVTSQQQGESPTEESIEQLLEPVTADTVRVDLTDPAIIEIIHVVAAAGFGMAYTASGVLRESTGRYPPHPCDVGGQASLNTVEGFKRCVVVDVDGEDAVCVLLDEVDVVSPGEFDQLDRHDLLMVKRTDLLHPDFASGSERPQSAVLH